VTFGNGGCIVAESTAAATALSLFARMPLDQHGSRKAIEHWRGPMWLSPSLDFHATPLSVGFCQKAV
jgi:hypothetical protein